MLNVEKLTLNFIAVFELWTKKQLKEDEELEKL